MSESPTLTPSVNSLSSENGDSLELVMQLAERVAEHERSTATWKEALRKAAADAHRKGFSLRQIALAAGVSNVAVLNWTREESQVG